MAFRLNVSSSFLLFYVTFASSSYVCGLPCTLGNVWKDSYYSKHLKAVKQEVLLCKVTNLTDLTSHINLQYIRYLDTPHLTFFFNVWFVILLKMTLALKALDALWGICSANMCSGLVMCLCLGDCVISVLFINLQLIIKERPFEVNLQ